MGCYAEKQKQDQEQKQSKNQSLLPSKNFVFFSCAFLSNVLYGHFPASTDRCQIDAFTPHRQTCPVFVKSSYWNLKNQKRVIRWLASNDRSLWSWRRSAAWDRSGGPRSLTVARWYGQGRQGSRNLFLGSWWPNNERSEALACGLEYRSDLSRWIEWLRPPNPPIYWSLLEKLKREEKGLLHFFLKKSFKFNDLSCLGLILHSLDWW